MIDGKLGYVRGLGLDIIGVCHFGLKASICEVSSCRDIIVQYVRKLER